MIENVIILNKFLEIMLYLVLSKLLENSNKKYL